MEQTGTDAGCEGARRVANERNTDFQPPRVRGHNEHRPWPWRRPRTAFHRHSSSAESRPARRRRRRRRPREVIASPILGALDGTPFAWLGELLRTFHRGDVDAFCAIVDSNSEQYKAQQALAARHDFLREKIALCALMNLVVETPPHERCLAFDAVATRTRLPRDQVGLSLGGSSGGS